MWWQAYAENGEHVPAVEHDACSSFWEWQRESGKKNASNTWEGEDAACPRGRGIRGTFDTKEIVDALMEHVAGSFDRCVGCKLKSS